MKKFVTVLAMMLLVTALLVGTALAAGAITVANAEGSVGGSVSMDVSITGNPGFNGGRLTVSYDKDLLTLTSIDTAGKLMAGGSANADRGIVNCAFAEDVTSDGVLCTLNFTIQQTNEKSSTVTVTPDFGSTTVDDLGIAATTGTVTIKAAPHEHVWGEGEVTKAATCTEEGVRTYTCSVCGETKTEAIPATGHDWDEGTVTTEATCEGTGVKTFICKNDSSHTKTEEIAAKGHDWDAGVVTKEPSCKEMGVRTYTCKNDASHTRTEDIAKTDHTWDEGVVTTEPTCKDEGVKTFTCTVCGETKTESIPKTDVHTIDPEADKTAAKNATVTDKGNVDYWTCSVCGKLFLDAEGKQETTLEEVQFDAQYEEAIQLGEVSEEDAALLTETATAAGYSDKNIKLIEATLMVSFDNGENWIEATEADIPSGGAVVAFDYPAGTNAKDYDFIIFHKKADGTIETLTPVKGEKLTVKVTSLSPFAIAWKEIPKTSANIGTNNGTNATGTKSTSPKTGDESNILLWASVFALCVTGAAVVTKKKIKG